MNAKSCCLIFTAGLLTAAIPSYAAQSQNPQSTQSTQSSQSTDTGSSATTPYSSQTDRATDRVDGLNNSQTNTPATQPGNGSGTQYGLHPDSRYNHPAGTQDNNQTGSQYSTQTGQYGAQSGEQTGNPTNAQYGTQPNTQSSDDMNSSQQPVRGSREAMKMVPARATFTHTIESQKAQPGQQLQVKLTKAVTLNNGTRLPKGTMLDGEVVNDTTQQGTARLALQFNQAKLESGQTVPIKATIVGIYNTPDGNENDTDGSGDFDSNPPSWNDGTLQVDQIDALPGIDLHSKVASRDSGVFVSNKKSDIKLSPNYSMTLAIAPGNQANSAYNSIPNSNSYTNMSSNQGSATNPR